MDPPQLADQSEIGARLSLSLPQVNARSTRRRCCRGILFPDVRQPNMVRIANSEGREPAPLRAGIRDWKRLGYASIRSRSALLDGLLPGFDPL